MISLRYFVGGTLLASSVAAIAATNDRVPNRFRHAERIAGLTVAFPKCRPTPTANVGVVWIDLPPDAANGQTITVRNVRHKNVPVAEEDYNDNSHQPGSMDNSQTDMGPEPLSAYITQMDLPPSGFLAIRVRIPTGKHYSFHVDDDHSIYGAGRIDPTDTTLCVRNYSADANIKERRNFLVSRFYVDLSKLPAGTHDSLFNVIVHKDSTPNIPLTIDPKIHNDG